MRVKIQAAEDDSVLVLPREALDRAGLEVGQEVEVRAGFRGVEVFRPGTRPTVEGLFAEAEKHGPIEIPPMVDWGPDVGAEILPDEDWSDIAPTDDEMGIADATSRRSSA